MDAYQEPFTMSANFSGQLETQRGTVDLTGTVVILCMGLYLAAAVVELDSQGRAVWDSPG
ncbi:hypothetical protein BZK31_04450 [Pseudomonas floridensis]|uniref:Uncharacterized protein n=1 Tax=Pseudomonas floridensis TaxID=1958950 RepID=A0A1X0NBD3_9PSED|nr:hypothetical protein BZK31_04450 [Pseudomonas floridensis]